MLDIPSQRDIKELLFEKQNIRCPSPSIEPKVFEQPTSSQN
jgi:hypothetical protein